MQKGRLEAFSDGVLAIAITIMVLELKMPHEPTLESLRPLGPVILSYILSFLFIGIYWNNHHHLFQAAKHVRGWVLWANLHLLFWLSLIPAVTAWMGETRFAQGPTALYGVVLLGCGAAYSILVKTLIQVHGQESLLSRAIGSDAKGMISLACYAAAVPLAFVHPYISGAVYVFVALMWLPPDPRIERHLESTRKNGQEKDVHPSNDGLS